MLPRNVFQNFSMQQFINHYDIYLEDVPDRCFMRKFSILCLLLLTSCNSFIKNEDSIKKFGHDAFDEELDDFLKEMQYHENIRRV